MSLQRKKRTIMKQESSLSMVVSLRVWGLEEVLEGRHEEAVEGEWEAAEEASEVVVEDEMQTGMYARIS